STTTRQWARVRLRARKPTPFGFGKSRGDGPTREGCHTRGKQHSDLTSSVRAVERGAVLLVGDVLAPRDRAAGLVVLLHGDVGHEAVRGRAVPVVLAGLEEDAVAGPDELDRAAFALAEAEALGDEDRL